VSGSARSVTSVDNTDGRFVIALTLAYNGALFHGFATQRRTLSTVQDRIEAALATRLSRKVEVVCAGRTDAGVHARGQVVSFNASESERPNASLLRSLNGLLDPGVVVLEARSARRGFSARFDAMTREYRYRIVDGPIPPLALSDFAWHVRKNLDVEAMREAAALLVVEHDFKSFCRSSSAEGRGTVRRVDSIDIVHRVELGEAYIEVRVVGNAFLHNMVRTMVGTLYEVGAGRRDPEYIRGVLALRLRDSAGQTAPAKGLTFWHVDYPEDVWL
jgi:tRNA pseudouridine38-40 synthase